MYEEELDVIRKLIHRMDGWYEYYLDDDNEITLKTYNTVYIWKVSVHDVKNDMYASVVYRDKAYFEGFSYEFGKDRMHYEILYEENGVVKKKDDIPLKDAFKAILYIIDMKHRFDEQGIDVERTLNASGKWSKDTEKKIINGIIRKGRVVPYWERLY